MTDALVQLRYVILYHSRCNDRDREYDVRQWNKTYLFTVYSDITASSCRPLTIYGTVYHQGRSQKFVLVGIEVYLGGIKLLNSSSDAIFTA